ncbi:hypothetical protein GOODEAATRI_033357 [Goodea atripinnis]|uniref:Uncharacterized protein n=1 Tax=Goodea atripinnis TaxID=208336 RepID=A0ABV0MMR3_9TELE
MCCSICGPVLGFLDLCCFIHLQVASSPTKPLQQPAPNQRFFSSEMQLLGQSQYVLHKNQERFSSSHHPESHRNGLTPCAVYSSIIPASSTSSPFRSLSMCPSHDEGLAA